MTKTHSIALIFIFTFLVLLSSTWADQMAVCEGGLTAYQQTLYPIQRQYCIACHGDGGMAIGHSVADPKLAYTTTRTLVDFMNVSSSTLLTKVKEQHWMDYGGSGIPVTVDQIQSLIEQWWSGGEAACPSTADLTSTALSIPSDLPARASNQFLTLKWDLGATNAKFLGCTLSVDIQQFTPSQNPIPGSYRLKSPRIGCTRAGITVSGVWFPVSGSVQGYENVFASIEQTLSPVPSEDQLVELSQDESIVIQRNFTANDTLSVLIEHLQLVPADRVLP